MTDTKERIIELLKRTGRAGMGILCKWLSNETDFFTAPASTKYHNSYEGGLADHSLAVYELLKEKNEKYKVLDDNTVIISALLHDVCKVNYYAKEKKNIKEGTKINDWGKEIANWVEKEVYVMDDIYPIGHGEKSVIILMDFIELTTAEKILIRWHMGFTVPKEEYRTLNAALDLYPEIALMHAADLEATYMIDRRGEK